MRKFFSFVIVRGHRLLQVLCVCVFRGVGDEIYIIFESISLRKIIQNY